MRNAYHRFGLIPIFWACICANSLADDRFADVRAYIEEQIEDGRPASLSVAVSRDGETVWSESWGLANRQRDVKADEHTMYSLASISKPVTATGLMLLVERGKIDLDRPVDEYLGEQKLTAYIGGSSDATVRRVAGHMAGLPLHYQFFYEDEPHVRPSMDETIRRYGILVTPPGERFQYSNLGYGILDYCVERTSGKPFAEFMRTEVFGPLGMTHTSIGIGEGLEEFAAERYRPDGQPIPFYDFDHRGASAVYASAHDLLRFGNLHLGLLPDEVDPILTEESLTAMREFSEPSTYGIGWSVNPHHSGVDVVSHGGGMGGVATQLSLVPERRLVVTALANSRDSLAYRSAGMIVDALLGEKTEAETQRPSPDEDRLSSLEGSQWSGQVITHNGAIRISISFEDDRRVYAQLGEQAKERIGLARFDGKRFRGQMVGDIGTPDANRTEYLLHFDLTMRDEVLNGSLVANSKPGPRVGNALASWVEVTREADDDSSRDAADGKGDSNADSPVENDS